MSSLCPKWPLLDQENISKTQSTRNQDRAPSKKVCFCYITKIFAYPSENVF